VVSARPALAAIDPHQVHAGDPLGADPIVVAGSANFSEASTNVLVIRGNTRVADIYLGEYMRLWNHYAFREWASSQADPADTAFKHLDITDGWTAEYFGDTDRSRQRSTSPARDYLKGCGRGVVSDDGGSSGIVTDG
jgi:hypothetical protein